MELGEEITVIAPPKEMDYDVQDRINARLIVYLEQHGEGIDETNVCFTTARDGREDGVYTRRKKATLEWEPLDLGWLEGTPVEIVVIENRAGKNPQVIPSPEEKAGTDASTIEIGISTGDGTPLAFTEIKAGRFGAFSPIAEVHYFVRGAVADSKYYISAIPG